MAKLPRHTAQVPQGLGSAGTTRATNLGALTDTGEQAKFAAKGAKYAAVGDMARSAQGVAEMIYRADQKRHGLETDQQLKDFQVEYDKQVANIWMEREDMQIKSREVRDAFRDDAVSAEDKIYEQTLKEYSKSGWLNDDVLIALNNNREGQKLLFFKDAHDLGTGKLDQYEQVNGKSRIGALVAAGDEKGARKQMAYYMSQNLFSEEDGKDILDEAITKKGAREKYASVENPEEGLSLAKNWVMSQDIDTKLKTKINKELEDESAEVEWNYAKNEEKFWWKITGDDELSPSDRKLLQTELEVARESGDLSFDAHKSLFKLLNDGYADKTDNTKRDIVKQALLMNQSYPSESNRKKAYDTLNENAPYLSETDFRTLQNEYYSDVSSIDASNKRESYSDMASLLGGVRDIRNPLEYIFGEEKDKESWIYSKILWDAEVLKAAEDGQPYDTKKKRMAALKIVRQVKREKEEGEIDLLGKEKAKYTKTATNPKTGERLGWDGTKWVPIQ